MRKFFLVLPLFLFLLSCGKKAATNAPASNLEEPDRVLFEKAMRDLEKNKFIVSRLNLQTLINTYDTSEFLAKAKLAIADSWYREGGSHGLAQAEAEYKDFILFYPTMEEAAEALSVSYTTVHRLLKRGLLKSSDALRKKIISRAELERWPDQAHRNE